MIILQVNLIFYYIKDANIREMLLNKVRRDSKYLEVYGGF